MPIINSLLFPSSVVQLLAILGVCTSVVVAQSPSQTSLALSWPAGTEAEGSSFHDPGEDGETFYGSNAVDGNLTTKWNDNTLGQYPDILTIDIPAAVTLAGIIILSGEDGWLLAYTVQTYNDSAWTTAAEISNTTSPIQLINFLGPVIATKVRINVTHDQSGHDNNVNDDYTRIHEVYPLFGTMSSSASNSTSTSSTDKSTSTKCSNAGAIAGGVVGGMAVIILAALAGFFLLIKQRKHGGSDLPEPKSDLNPQELYPQELAPGSPHPAANSYEVSGEAEHATYAATPTELSNHAT